MSDLGIHEITIYFTASTIIIGTIEGYQSEAYLKVHIIPTSDFVNIQKINITFFNPANIPSRLNEELSDYSIFQTITLSMKGTENTLYEKITSYMKRLSQEEAAIIIKEYSKYIQNGVVLDGCIAGIGTYLAFLILIENSIFANQIPFQFSLPTQVMSGNTVNHNMFQYVSLPLMSLIKISSGMLFHITTFIQTFINIWDPLFTSGPIIGITNETKMCLEIISGLSTYVSTALAETKIQQENINKQLATIELRLQHQVTTAIHRLTTNINTLLKDNSSNPLLKDNSSNPLLKDNSSNPSRNNNTITNTSPDSNDDKRGGINLSRQELGIK